jgi:predicted esterase
MNKNQVQFNIKAPYFTVGDVGEKTKTIWIIFHGYGQLVDDFYGHFSLIDPVYNKIVFPQGLSKFYLRGVDKQIGASWMTAYDRETDIENYNRYLDQIYSMEVDKHELDVNIIGFSQGAHTASRWIHNSKIPYKKFIAWGAGLASEIDKEMIHQSFNGENYVVIGDQDRFINADALESMKIRYEAIGFNYSLISYQGAHDIYPEVLKFFF